MKSKISTSITPPFEKGFEHLGPDASHELDGLKSQFFVGWQLASERGAERDRGINHHISPYSDRLFCRPYVS